MPAAYKSFSRTMVFSETTLPAELFGPRRLRAGTQAEIEVVACLLAYRIINPLRPFSQALIAPSSPRGLIEPAVEHLLSPQGQVRF